MFSLGWVGLMALYCGDEATTTMRHKPSQYQNNVRSKSYHQQTYLSCHQRRVQCRVFLEEIGLREEENERETERGHRCIADHVDHLIVTEKDGKDDVIIPKNEMRTCQTWPLLQEQQVFTFSPFSHSERFP
jgi:hypothetical protein